MEAIALNETGGLTNRTQKLMEEMDFERDVAEEAASRQLRVLFGKP